MQSDHSRSGGPITGDPQAIPLLESGELEWMETAGIENLKGRIATTDALAKESVNTLTVLLAGAGGSWAYALKILDEGATRGAVAACAAGAWLTLLAMALVAACLIIRSIPAVYNQPGNLLRRQQSGESYTQWRIGELRNIDVRIKRATARNNLTATRLNWIRILAIATPLLAGMAVLAFDPLDDQTEAPADDFSASRDYTRGFSGGACCAGKETARVSRRPAGPDPGRLQRDFAWLASVEVPALNALPGAGTSAEKPDQPRAGHSG